MQAPDLVDDMAAELDFALAAARTASEVALDFWKRGPRHWYKDDGSPVSEGDLAVDNVLREALLDRRPDYGWLSEETPDDPRRLALRRVWIADPIDGTRDFITGGKDWCVAFALLIDGKPALSIVSCPVLEEVFTATLGNGAFLNSHRLRISDRARFADADIVANKSVLTRLGKAPGSAPRLALSLRLCRIAQNLSDAAVATTPKHDWDLAPGDLIVREAGGLVSTADGSPYLFNRPETRQAGLIAAAPHLHQDIVEALRTT